MSVTSCLLITACSVWILVCSAKICKETYNETVYPRAPASSRSILFAFIHKRSHGGTSKIHTADVLSDVTRPGVWEPECLEPWTMKPEETFSTSTLCLFHCYARANSEIANALNRGLQTRKVWCLGNINSSVNQLNQSNKSVHEFSYKKRCSIAEWTY